MNHLADLPPSLTHAFEASSSVKGRVQVHVVDAKKGRVLKTLPWQDNLILDQGMDYYATNTWANLMNYCVAGTGMTPTRDLLDGNASQSGTTVTLSGSTYDFSGDDVGKWIGWAAGGYQAKITDLISATEVTVDRSQSVSAATATLYRANQTGLEIEVKRTNTYPVYTYADNRGASATFASATNVLNLRRTYDFTAEVAGVNYTEIGISPIVTAGNNLFARILFDGAVTVASGQQLRITYELAVTINGTTRPTQALTSSTGWPYAYGITSISGDGTAFTVTVTAPHHYVAGGLITIAGAKRPRTAVNAAVSTGATFTLTTVAAHGLVAGDSISVDGMTPVGYNGTWVAAVGTTGTTVVVTTAANPGTGTGFGNVRQTEPGTWYDGTWTIASVTASTIVVTSAIALAAGADGTVVNNLNAVMYLNHWPISPLGGASGYGTPEAPLNTQWGAGGLNSFNASTVTLSPGAGTGGICAMDGTFIPLTTPQNNCILCAKTSAITPPGAFPIGGQVAVTGVTSYSVNTVARQAYAPGSFFRDILLEWATGNANSSTLRGILFSQKYNDYPTNDFAFGWLFDQPQRKDSTNRLRITFRHAWTRQLA